MKIRARVQDEHIQHYREQIGRSIRSMREKQGLSQDELAAIMDVQRSTISKIENGRFSVSVDYIIKFAWYLDFDIALLPKQISAGSDAGI